MLEFFQQLNWLVVGQIILIDILLGGDNAIVIALACRHLPEHLRMKGIVGGALGAIVLRVVLIAFAVTLLSVPYLKIIGGILLIWIGMKLLLDEGDDIAVVDLLFLVGQLFELIENPQQLLARQMKPKRPRSVGQCGSSTMFSQHQIGLLEPDIFRTHDFVGASFFQHAILVDA